MNGFPLGPADIHRFSFALVFPVLLLIIHMSIRLYRSGGMVRRRSAFVWMCLAVSASAVHEASPLLFGASDAAQWADRWMETAAFLWMQLSLFQLYNVPRSGHYVGLLAALAPAAVLSAATAVLPADAEDLLFRLYRFALVALCYWVLPERTGQPALYRAMLAVDFLVLGVEAVNRYAYGGGSVALLAAERGVRFLFYTMLFAFLFERTVELLHGIYRTAVTDGLTGLYNRSYAERRLSACVRHKTVTGLLFVDIDNFKRLNDTHGHAKGDEAIRQVARILAEEAATCGFAARFGGEEMIVVVTNPGEPLDDLAERIRKTVERRTDVTVSIGYVRYRSGMTARDLLRFADEAMYRAKTAGKNRTVAYGRKPLSPTP